MSTRVKPTPSTQAQRQAHTRNECRVKARHNGLCSISAGVASAGSSRAVGTAVSSRSAISVVATSVRPEGYRLGTGRRELARIRPLFLSEVPCYLINAVNWFTITLYRYRYTVCMHTNWLTELFSCYEYNTRPPLDMHGDPNSGAQMRHQGPCAKEAAPRLGLRLPWAAATR